MSTKANATIEDLYHVPDNRKAEIVNGDVVLMSPTGSAPNFASLPFPVFHSPSLPMSRTFRMGRTPQTIVVSPESRVVKSWHGAYANLYDKATQTEIETFFRVSLPGLSPEAVSASPRTGS